MNPRTALLAAGALGTLFGVPAVRRRVLTRGLMRGMQRLGFLPTISDTEKTAIEAGTVWVDGELFSGRPDLDRLAREPFPDLTDAERAFVDGPCETVCRMTTDWEVQRRRDLPPEVWDYLKRERFFGLIIPEAYGGRGFSASANSAVVAKLSARSQTLGITVMVPNSLGPAELLIHYGTDAQRDHYLPRLARGEEIPCFALTEPNAGSDAGGLRSEGEVFRGDDGALKLRLNWSKRYITLAPVATVLGLAFRLRDPQNLLGRGTDPGITCALVPANAPGAEVGRRHDPLGIPFQNGPTEGTDVVVPIDAIIGGADGAGRGWRMLMESLAAGRGISLPAAATGGAKAVYRAAGAHAAVRKQFGLSIGRFEGVEEPLARIGGFTYLLEAARRYTCGALDGGAKPAVVSAIAKYHATELARRIVNDGMDILAGNAISEGPRNLVAAGYHGMPISITVEGANILTRTLMIFGQGAIRCHPYVLKEVQALEAGDEEAFDRAFWAHVAHVGANKLRALGLSATRGAFVRAPVDGPAAPYYRKLAWASASFAFLADVALGMLGGTLKRKEKIAGRFADILSWMYLATATLARFEAEGRRREDEPFMQWACEYAFARIQEAFDGLYANLDLPAVRPFLRGPMRLWSRLNPIGTEPSDRLGQRVAQAMQEPGALRERHTSGLFLSGDVEDALGRLEHAFRLHHAAADVEAKIKDAVRDGRLERARPAALLAQARARGVITEAEAEGVRRAEAARDEYVRVDAFTVAEYFESAALVDPEGDADPAPVAPAPPTRDEDVIATV